MYDITFNGQTAVDNHILVVRRPNIPAPLRRIQTIQIPAVDGDLYIDDNAIEDINITVEMNFMNAPDRWQENFRKAKKWLYGRGTMKLILSDDPNFFYRVKFVQIEEAERVCYEIGRFSVVFTCAGYNYLCAGDVEHDPEDVRYNPYEKALPIYVIRGQAAGQLTVNGNIMQMDVSDTLYIDTEKKISYRENGGIVNSAVTGDYDDLALLPGKNEVAISEKLALKVIPRWRCV